MSLSSVSEIDFGNSTAIDVIEWSATYHRALFIKHLRKVSMAYKSLARLMEGITDGGSGISDRMGRQTLVMALRLEAGNFDTASGPWKDIAAVIVAFNVAATLQGVPGICRRRMLQQINPMYGRPL